jgi:hypothetical protein
LIEKAHLDESSGIFGIGLIEDEIAQRGEAQRLITALPCGRWTMRMATENETGSGMFSPPR